MKFSLALALVFLGFTELASAAENCALKQIAWLDFSTTSGGQPSVLIKIADKDARVIVDTGSAYSLLDDVFAKSAGLEQRMRDAPQGLGASGTQLATTKLRSLHIGEVDLGKSYEFLVMPNGRAEWGGNVAGTLGVNVLGDFEVEFDMARRKIGIYLQKHCRGKVVYWAGEWAEIPLKGRRGDHAAVQLDGRDLTASLDTGSRDTILDLETATKLFGFSPGGAVTSVSGGASPGAKSSHQGDRAKFKILSMGGVQVQGPSIRVAPLSGADIILGMQHLQYLHLYFAYGENKVYATAARATFPDPARQATRAPREIAK